VAIFAAVAISIGASLVFILADSLEMLFVGRLLSGLALPLASGAWIVEFCEDRCTAASLSAGAILAGLGLGALISGLLADYSFIALVSFALAAAVIVWLLPETVEVRRLSEIALRPRIGVPLCIIGAFIAPAVTVFASFALFGFYSALVPSLLPKLRLAMAARGKPETNVGALCRELGNSIDMFRLLEKREPIRGS